MTIEPLVPLPKIVTTVTCPTEHNAALHDARSQQIMAHKFLKEHLADLFLHLLIWAGMMVI